MDRKKRAEREPVRSRPSSTDDDDDGCVHAAGGSFTVLAGPPQGPGDMAPPKEQPTPEPWEPDEFAPQPTPEPEPEGHDC